MKYFQTTRIPMRGPGTYTIEYGCGFVSIANSEINKTIIYTHLQEHNANTVILNNENYYDEYDIADTGLVVESIETALGCENLGELSIPGTSLAVNQVQPFGFDAGGRTRVSQITTLLDGKILGEDDTLLFQNAGTGTFPYADNKVTLTTDNGQYAIRQSKRFYPYYSGKSQLIECTFDGFQTERSTIKRVGYFSSNSLPEYTGNFDGFFIENNEGEQSLKAYRNGVETISVLFSEMDNYELISSYDWSKFTVIAFDFLWLGGAVLRFFVKTSQGFSLIHTVNYSGTAADTFIKSPNQPIRYEIRNIGVGGVTTFRYICSQIATEGSINESGKTLALYNSTAITCNTVGTIYALKSIKKQAAFRDVGIQVIDISLGITATTDSGILMLILNPTLSAPIVYANKYKIQEGTPTNQTITANTGRVLCASAVNASSSIDIMKENFLGFLGGNIDNSMDEYVVAYMPTTNNQTVHAILDVKEL